MCSKWCINFSCGSSWRKEGSFYWLTEKGQSGGNAIRWPLQMEWYFVWRNQNRASKWSQWGTETQLHYWQEKREKMKELTQRREPQRDQVWHSDCHLADFPLGLHFPATCGRHFICHASKYKNIINDWRIITDKYSAVVFSKLETWNKSGLGHGHTTLQEQYKSWINIKVHLFVILQINGCTIKMKAVAPSCFTHIKHTVYTDNHI